MRYVQCKKCEKVYPGSLKKCPDCKTKTPPSTARIVLGIFLVMFSVIFMFAGAIGWSEGDSSSSGSTPTSDISDTDTTQSSQPEKTGKVNYANFEKIKNGMTYQQVVEILGEEGKIMSETDVGLGEEYKTTLYYWYDKTGIANCNVMIQGGKVVSKSQMGLR